MKRTIILVGILSMFLLSATAQDFQGVATYKTKRKLDIKLDSTQVNSEMHQRMMAMLKKQFEKTYILTFDKESSVYKEEEALEAPQAGGMRMVVMTAGASDILYKNIKENRFTSQSEVLGKIFLVKDELEKQDWTLEKDTKFIGEYTCHKATMKRMIEVRESGISINGDRDFDDENTEPEMREVAVTAWYTMQIPVNSGPARFHGLPGLILEVNDGEETIICSKIVLNPKEKLTVKEPVKGKEISQKDFEAVVEKKMQEQAEKYEHRRGDDGGHRIEIRVGG
ncbi:GLPGLI family protein [Seonamhaeicola maritimus]|uniref:GLPGLI family protein n=1 Tax=Seonamhaeicola maritimus TaxID=2591822 RepID=A0A5C7GJD9_9FLAO|nr:GLPGLI family protein [Seonamhaeicola maritimus]TXG38470.1 GLPGLI family protein [Seonamhaeicola maritimus]